MSHASVLAERSRRPGSHNSRYPSPTGTVAAAPGLAGPGKMGLVCPTAGERAYRVTTRPT